MNSRATDKRSLSVLPARCAHRTDKLRLTVAHRLKRPDPSPRPPRLRGDRSYRFFRCLYFAFGLGVYVLPFIRIPPPACAAAS